MSDDNSPEGVYQRAGEEQFDAALAASKAEGVREERERCVRETQAYKLMATVAGSEAWRMLSSLLGRIRGNHLKPGVGK